MNTYVYTYKDENNNNLKVQYTKAYYSDNPEQIHTFWLPSRIVKNKLDKMKDLVYDVDKIDKAKDKQQEVINQMVKLYNEGVI